MPEGAFRGKFSVPGQIRHLSSYRMSQLSGRYQIILLGERQLGKDKR